MTNVYLNDDQSIEIKIEQKREQVAQDFQSLHLIDKELQATLSISGLYNYSSMTF